MICLFYSIFFYILIKLTLLNILIFIINFNFFNLNIKKEAQIGIIYKSTLIFIISTISFIPFSFYITLGDVNAQFYGQLVNY